MEILKFWIAALLFGIVQLSASAQTQIGSDITPIEFNQGTGINVRVSADGNRMVFGSRLAPINGNDMAGAARVYENTNGSWSQLGQILQGDSEFEFFGETVDISDDGNLIVVGSDEKVSAYSFNGSQWQQVGQDVTVTNIDGVRELALSSSGEILAVLFRVSGDYELHIFTLVNDSWQLMGVPFTGDVDKDFALDGAGTKVAIHYDSPDTDEISTYEFANGAWQQVGVTLEAIANYGFDNSEMSADGNKLMVFSANNTNNGVQGFLSTYDFVNSSWVENVDQLDFTIDNVFRTSMAPSANGTRLAFGTSDDNFMVDFNSVKVFEIVGNQWQQAGDEIQIWAHDEQLPNFVAITADGRKVSMSSLLGGPGVQEGTISAYDYTAVLTVNEHQSSASFLAFPNPTTGTIAVDLSENVSEIIATITNTFGQVVVMERFSDVTTFQLKLHGSTGVYFLRLHTHLGNSKTLKIIKQ